MSAPVRIVVANADAAELQRWAFAVRDALWRSSDTPHDFAETVLAGGDAERVAARLAAELERGTDAACVVIAAGLDARHALELLLSGANAVLTQPHPKWLVRHAVAIAGSGGMFLDPWLAHEVADGLRPRRGNLRGVTGSEQRVLLAASRGLDVRAIAQALDVSMDTVKGHLRSVQHRLGVGRKELIRTARAAGLLPAGNGRAGADTWDTTRGLAGLSVFVVSRERLARETLMGTLRAAGAHVVGQAADVQGVSSASGAWQVTLVLLHAADAGLLELKAARPEAGLAVVPWVLNTRTFHGALAARAQAIVGVDAHLDELIVGLRLAAAGGLYFHTAALRVALKAVDQARAGAAGPLTGRQVDVLSLAARGMSNREIARELGLAEPTVKGHVRSALKLLDAASRREAAQRARARGWLDAG